MQMKWFISLFTRRAIHQYLKSWKAINQYFNLSTQDKIQHKLYLHPWTYSWKYIFFIFLTDCGKIPSLDNGIFLLADTANTRFGAKAFTQCNLGYSADKQYVTCQQSGNWESNVSCILRGKIYGGVHSHWYFHILSLTF